MLTCLTNLLHGEEGATLIEYSFMVAFIALLCVGAITALGAKLGVIYAAVPPALR